jgi:predicted aspartyl protease
LIKLDATYDYVLRIDSYIKTKTSKNPQWLEMVYDTGAGTTTISRRVALDAGYAIKKSSEYVEGLGGRVKADYAIIPDLILGGVSLGPVYVHVVDFHNELARKTEAVLGMNVLMKMNTTVRT